VGNKNRITAGLLGKTPKGNSFRGPNREKKNLKGVTPQEKKKNRNETANIVSKLAQKCVVSD